MDRNPYNELEAAYVAQICLTWEALNWNYKYFQQLRSSPRDSDPGCPAYIAQQFQQFQVLLQRYVENEPYDHGRRPEIYARMRSVAPKLLQVPEYRGGLFNPLLTCFLDWHKIYSSQNYLFVLPPLRALSDAQFFFVNIYMFQYFHQFAVFRMHMSFWPHLTTVDKLRLLLFTSWDINDIVQGSIYLSNVRLKRRAAPEFFELGLDRKDS